MHNQLVIVSFYDCSITELANFAKTTESFVNLIWNLKKIILKRKNKQQQQNAASVLNYTLKEIHFTESSIYCFDRVLFFTPHN